MIFGIMGCCRVDEMTKITVNDIKEEGKVLIVNIPQENAKNNKARQFFINADMTTIVKRYQRLRPKDMPTDRFFINYQKGVCTKQPIGKNKIHSIPKTIARWLGLEDPTVYSGLAIRHTSDTYLSNSEHGSTIVMKRFRGLNSDKVAQGYQDNPLENDVKPDIAAISINLNENSMYDDEPFVCAESMVDPLGDSNEVEEQPKCSSPPLKRRRIERSANSRTSRSSSPQETDDTQDSSVNIHLSFVYLLNDNIAFRGKQIKMFEKINVLICISGVYTFFMHVSVNITLRIQAFSSFKLILFFF